VIQSPERFLYTASLAVALLVLAPCPATADAVLSTAAGAAAKEKTASRHFASQGGSNVKGTLTLAAEKRWGHDYMHARYYNPTLGRFLSVDPVMADTSSSQSWNRYSYVINNPVKLVDPNGETWLEAVEGFLQGVGGSLSFGLADITQPSPNDTADQRTGQMAGALVVQAVAAYTIADGTAKMGAGGALIGASFTNGGTSAAPGAVLVTAGAGQVAVGTVMAAGATSYLSQAMNSSGGEPSGGKVDPDKPAEQVLRGKSKREFPGEHSGKSLNEIRKELRTATGQEKRSLQKAKKILEQQGRIHGD
jgi:RHS repeat-associated protein